MGGVAIHYEHDRALWRDVLQKQMLQKQILQPIHHEVHLFFISLTSLFLVVSSNTWEAGEPTAIGTAGLGGDTVKMAGPVEARKKGMVCIIFNSARFTDVLALHLGLFPILHMS